MLQKGRHPVVLSVGRIYCDLVFTDVPRMPSLGTETFAGGLSLHAGGGAFNSAVAFSVLGQPTVLAGMLPAAPFDVPVMEEGVAAGIDMSLCRRAPEGAAPQITVAMTVESDRAFLSHKSGAAVPDLDMTAPVLASVGHLHFGELRTLCEAPDLFARARREGWTVSLDCGWDDELMEKGADLAGLIAGVDVFLPNESEYAALKASGLPGDCCPVTVVKEGASGASACRAGEWLHDPALAVEVVDATGAGDAFNGGFLSAWFAGKDLKACLENGNRCGAAAVQHAGGTVGLLKADPLFQPV